MALSKLGAGNQYGMQMLAGPAGNDTEGGSQIGRGSRGILNLAVERIARAASNIISSGSVTGGGGVRPGDVTGGGGGGEAA